MEPNYLLRPSIDYSNYVAMALGFGGFAILYGSMSLIDNFFKRSSQKKDPLFEEPEGGGSLSRRVSSIAPPRESCFKVVK